MQAQEFAEFVARQQQDGADDAQMDWTMIREEWLRDLDFLYGRIIGFLQDFITKGSIRYSFADITLTEANIGTYRAKRMDISIGRQHLFLEPIGTLLIGFKGRVDVVGSIARAQLMLVNENARSVADLVTITIGDKTTALPPVPKAEQAISWTWRILAREPRGTFVDLDKDSFFDLLVEVVGA